MILKVYDLGYEIILSEEKLFHNSISGIKYKRASIISKSNESSVQSIFKVKKV